MNLLAPSGLNDLLLYRFSRIVNTAGTMVVRLCEGRFGITRREWRILALLAEHAMRPSLLAELAHLDRTRTSRATSSLLAKGLILREVEAGDQRFALISLTAPGREVYDTLFPLVAEINRRLLTKLETAQVKTLEDLLVVVQQQADSQLAGSKLPTANRRRGRRVVDSEDRKFKRPFLTVAGLGPALDPLGAAAEVGTGGWPAGDHGRKTPVIGGVDGSTRVIRPR